MRLDDQSYIPDRINQVAEAIRREIDYLSKDRHVGADRIYPMCDALDNLALMLRITER